MRASATIIAFALAALGAACGQEQYGQQPETKTGDITENQGVPSNPGSGPDAAISPNNSDAPDPMAEPKQAAPPATTTP